MKEIGSEFWSNCTPILDVLYSMRPAAIYGSNRVKVLEVLSGRTALEYIVEFLIKQGEKKAYLPSYCCHTMIEPFLTHGMEVSFYDVEWAKGGLRRRVDYHNNADVILLMDYFGHCDTETNVIAKKAMEMGITVVYDATHSMYSRVDYASCDFIYGSYRKWVDVNCGFLARKEKLGKDEIAQGDNNDNYASIRTRLFDLKADYINGGNTTKEQFLPLIETAETILENEYHHKRPDKRSLEVLKTADVDYLKHRRKENARTLTEAINDMKDERVRCLNPLIDSNDTSLFVPVMVTSRYRNSLRRYLIDQDIYCPVHWPLSDLHKPMIGSKQLFESELSLICDQRYDEKDMMRIADTIKEFLKKN